MKKLLIISFFLMPLFLVGQAGGGVQTVAGTVEVQALQDLKIEIVDPSPLTFSDPSEIEKGIYRPGYYRLTIISNVPWLITVETNTPFLKPGSVGASSNANISMVEVKGNKGGFISLTNTPQTVLISETNAIKTVFYIDLRVKPSVLTSGGKYSSPVLFLLSPQ